MKTLALTLILLSTQAFAQATECRQYPDGTVICYPIGGGSTYGK